MTINEAYELNPYDTEPWDQAFRARQVERLLRFADIDSSVQENRLVNLLFANLESEKYPGSGGAAAWAQRELARLRMRRFFTHESWDLNRYNIPPVFADPTVAPLSTNSDTLAEDKAKFYPAADQESRQHNGVLPIYTGTTNPPTVRDLGTTTAFGPRLPQEIVDGKRYDLNRPLTAYLHEPDQADKERTSMAEQLYVLLTMSCHPTSTPQKRVLAQLAVNIVDYIDPDSVMTTMTFDDDISDGWSAPSDEAHTVIGFELPELVINEGIALFYPYTDPATSSDRDKVWVWAELFNPWPTDADGSTDYLEQTLYDATANKPYYMLGVRVTGKTPADPHPTAGDESFVNFADSDVVTGVDASAIVKTIPARGYYLIGPEGTSGASGDPMVADEPDALLNGWSQPDTSSSNGGSNDFSAKDLKFDRPQSLTVGDRTVKLALYRLRNPFRDFNNSLGASFNPYVAIDGVELVDSEGSYRIDTQTNDPTVIDDRISEERRQPWQGDRIQWKPDDSAATTTAEGSEYLGFPDLQQPGTPSSLPDPASPTAGNALYNSGFVACNGTDGNTLGDINAQDAPLYISFPFLNRQLASPLELLSVRLYGAHYWTNNGGFNEWRLRFTDDFEYIREDSGGSTDSRVWRSRQVPWFLENRNGHPISTQQPFAHLYRFFEFVECHSRLNGAGGWDTNYDPAADTRQSRVAGKININLVTEEEVFKALLDTEEAMYAQPGGSSLPVDSACRPSNYVTDSTRCVPWDSLLYSGESDASVKTTSNIDLGGGNTAPLPAAASFYGNKQMPGVVDGPVSGDFPGWNQDEQVSSEMFRMLLLSRAGRDGIIGTGDDKPFRSFASNRVSDTLLRRRNYAALDYPVDGAWDATNDPAQDGYAPGEFIFKLGGQWVPRLFDPIANPFDQVDDGVGFRVRERIDITTLLTDHGSIDYASGSDKHVRDDYWMLEHRRNRLLGKIAGNVTTRSHLFAAWVTVGFFRVQPGTGGSTNSVPLLNEELGIATGENVRHRAFFIIDRSLAEGYQGPEEPALRENPLITHFSIIE